MVKASARRMFRLYRKNSHLYANPSRTRELGDVFQFSERHHEIARAQSQAQKNYKPQIYEGTLTLLRARMQPFLSSHDPEKGWGRLAAGGLEIRIVPGNHLAMLQEPHVKALAKEIRACLDKGAGRVPAHKS